MHSVNEIEEIEQVSRKTILKAMDEWFDILLKIATDEDLEEPYFRWRVEGSIFRMLRAQKAFLDVMNEDA